MNVSAISSSLDYLAVILFVTKYDPERPGIVLHVKNVPRYMDFRRLPYHAEYMREMLVNEKEKTVDLYVPRAENVILLKQFFKKDYRLESDY